MPGPNSQQRGRERLLGRREAAGAPCTHLNAPEDAVGVYPVLGATEDGCGVVVTLVPRAMAANTEKGEQECTVDGRDCYHFERWRGRGQEFTLP